MRSFVRSVRILAGAGLVAGALMLVVPSVAQAAMTVSGKPKVSFFAVGSPGFLDIEGVASVFTATDDGAKLTFVVPMASVESGISLRDDHMNNEYVKVAQFPNATLVLTKADVKWPAAVAESSTGTVKGTFNVHGVDQPVDIAYTVKKSKTGYRVNAKFPFDVTQHGIAIPSYLGITVDPKMNADVQVDLVDG
ncbi:MAG: YceI family protein [Pseudomonadota bacterium]|nr:YceI family protein [Pseudomonadota bacterium]